MSRVWVYEDEDYPVIVLDEKVPGYRMDQAADLPDDLIARFKMARADWEAVQAEVRARLPEGHYYK